MEGAPLGTRSPAAPPNPAAFQRQGMATELNAAMLLSDIQAFKAANPGACLADFVRWHSPRDWEGRGEGDPGCLSLRMSAEVRLGDGKRMSHARTCMADAPPATHPPHPPNPKHISSCTHARARAAAFLPMQGNLWQRLWASAAPLSAAHQKPLLRPSLEGERALHFLEILPPAALYAELLALGASAALCTLSPSGGGGGSGGGEGGGPAALPIVRAEVAAVGGVARAWLADGIAGLQGMQGVCVCVCVCFRVHSLELTSFAQVHVLSCTP